MANNPYPSSTIVSKDVTPENVERVFGFLKVSGVSHTIPPEYEAKDSYSDLIRSFLKTGHIHRGRVTCVLSVKPPILNFFQGLHGGVVAAVAEMISIACARTVVGKEKDLFLGELSMSYLSSAAKDAEVIVDASVVRSGRNLTVISIEFRIKGSERLAYTSRATFYNMPVSSL